MPNRRDQRRRGGDRQWRRVDLHLHTPASADWQEPDATYLEWLQKAEARGLDIVAITDHNTVAGVRRLREEIEDLTKFERLQRLRADERRRLDEFRRLGNRVLVLPGFEFTATLGFHILGLFPPETAVRELEFLLLSLNVPPEKLDAGSTEVGPTTDVLTAYHLINEMGGLVIAAHANSSHGVAMRGLGFGGQTKIAFTQDSNLHALEVTDLESHSPRSTAHFYSGSKPEYPRRMHCIQGSDAHRVSRDLHNKDRLGIGDRVTEILLEEVSFEALKQVFLDNDFARTRPARPPTRAPFDHVRVARDQGPSIIQSFHENMTREGGHLHRILCDVVAFVNTKGGTIYIGALPESRLPPVGVPQPEAAVQMLIQELRRINPPVDISVDIVESQGVPVLRVSAPEGADKPYALDGSHIYVRAEMETSLALRDEIVRLVNLTLQQKAPDAALQPQEKEPEAIEIGEPVEIEVASDGVEPPTVGVEITEVVERNGTLYYTVKDLRNGSVVRDVTKGSARKLWSYAIQQHQKMPLDESEVQWLGNIGLWHAARRAGKMRHDFVQRDADGTIHIYYGVTEEGIEGEWRKILPDDETRPPESEAIMTIEADSVEMAVPPEVETAAPGDSEEEPVTIERSAALDSGRPETPAGDEKPKRRRRTSKKKATAKPEIPPDGAEEPAAVAEAPAETPADEKPKRRRRTSKKKATTTSEAPSDGAEEPTAAAAEVSAVTATAEEKPKRRRRPSKKKASEPEG